MFKLFVIFFVCAGGTFYCQNEQDTLPFKPMYKKGAKYEFKTVVGTLHIGFVVAESKDFVTIENRTIHEKMEVRKLDIVTAIIVSDKKAYDDLLGENYHADNYLFSSSAFEFVDGAWVTHHHWLLLQHIDYSVSKNWAFTSNAIAFYPISIGIKYSYGLDDMNFIGINGFGVGHVFNTNPNTSPLFGYGLIAKYTHGSGNRNFTVSGGILGINSDWVSSTVAARFINLPFLSLGYCNRFSRNVAFAGECWYLPASQAFIGGAGLKLVGNEMYCWSFGLYALLDTYSSTFKINANSIPIPYIGVSRKF